LKVVKFFLYESTSYSLVRTPVVQGVSFSHIAQRHRQTDRQRDDIIMPIADHTPGSTWRKGENPEDMLAFYYSKSKSVLVVQRVGFGLVIERSLVRLPAGALSSQLGQLSLPSLRSRKIEYQPAWLGLGRARSLVSGGR